MAVITKQELEDAALDAQTLETVANGDSNTTATSRLGTTVKSVAKAIGEISAYDDKSAWATTTSYVLKDLVQSGGITYICTVAHTSGTFATDLAAGKWGIFQTQTPELFLSSYSDLAAAITAIGASDAQLIIDKDDTLTANVTIPSNISTRHVKGNIIATDGFDLIHNGTIVAGDYQIFDDTTGTVTGEPSNDVIKLEWFGLLVGDVSGNAETNSNVIESVQNFRTTSLGGTMIFPNGIVFIKRAIQTPRGWKFKGVGRKASVIKRTDTTTELLDSVATASIFYVNDTWIDIEDMTITGVGAGVAVDGITFHHTAPQSHLNFNRIDVQLLRTGFTEAFGLFMATFTDVNVASIEEGFLFESLEGKTSLTFDSCYVSSSNGQPWKFVNTIYSTLNGCGADACNTSNKDTEDGVYDFFTCNCVLNGCGSEGSYGNGTVRSQSSQLVINGLVSLSGRSEFVPDYVTYTNFGVGPIQTGVTFNNLNINSPQILDWQNTVVNATYPTKPVADLVSFNYDGLAFDFNMVDVGSVNIAPTSLFAGNGNTPKYCKISQPPTVVGAYNSGGFGSTSFTFTKVPLDTEEFDVRGVFASDRFTPDIPGYYHIAGSVQFSGTFTRTMATIYKNGVEYKRGVDGNNTQSTVNTLVYMDGTTDYIELYAYAVGTTPAIVAGQAYTYMSCSLDK